VKKYSISTVIFYLLLSIVFSNSYAGSVDKLCQEKRNKIVCGNGVIDQVKYLDDVIFNGTTISGHTKVIGDVNASHTHFNTLDITGDFKGDNVVIDGNAKLLGDLHFEHVIFHSDVNITGDVKITQVQFLNRAKVVGNVTCEEGRFDDALTLSAAATTLSHTITKNIEFTPSIREQILYLNGSTVNGNIKFLSNNGIVYSNEGSNINGNIIGGKLINQY
jgi:cytoskeletal protein CcmA (bactofilin family)